MGNLHRRRERSGNARRYGGIHFRSADLTGRLLGRLVAYESWQKAQTYFNGAASSETRLAETSTTAESRPR
jgi:hypothetical protein